MVLQQHNISDNNFEQCIKCTICTVYCPVAAVNPAYPGPKQAGPDGERLRLKQASFYDDALKYCLNCKKCEVACPSNVRIGDIIQAARLKYDTNPPKLRDYVLSHTDFVGTFSTFLAPVVNKTVKLPIVKTLMDQVLAIDHRRIFPTYAEETFKQWYEKQEAEQKNFPRQVSYFHGCYVNYNHPQLGKDLIKVLNTLGVGVQLLRKEKCCGVALIANGFVTRARKFAQVNVASIRESVITREIPVVTTSSTCTFTIRDEYPHLLDIYTDDIRNQIELATRYIYRLLKEDNTGLKLKNRMIKVAYHTPCHMEKLGWAYYSIELLRLIPTIELQILPPRCCGIAGTYGFKKENYRTSQNIGASLFDEIEDDTIDYIITDCETCKWQIEMSTSKQCKHPISVLAAALE
ncbi:MAG: anaerobic glycerol-3-phosphate dehydrogenase subunit C [Tannerellaceae bacterium]|nr:anaerobic glycerol-3-phosphate dehydrogenase subunit C [Tannerellaceae bacterium]